MDYVVKNKNILKSNIALIEGVIKSKDSKHNKEKVKGNILLHVNFKESELGYVKVVVEESGIMSYMYLPFYNVSEERNEDGVNSKNIYKLCNEVNKMLSPARLVVNDDKVYCLSLVPINVTNLKKTEILDIFHLFKHATLTSLSAFKGEVSKVGASDE
jgi:hypothetical protein